jgi:hypothetical protein
MTLMRVVLVAFIVAACGKSEAPSPASKGAPVEVAKPTASAATQAPPAPASSPHAAAPLGRPASVTDAQLATVDKLLKAFADLGAILELAKNCDQVRSALEAAVEPFAEIQPEMKRAVDEINADPAANAWFEATYADRMKAAALPFMTRVATCKDDPGVMKAMGNLPMMKKKTAAP